MAGVIAHNLFHRVGGLRAGVDVLRDVSMTAAAGEVTAVVGPAGAGKTSLLHVLAGLDRPASGTVALDGRNLRGVDDIELTRLRRDRIGLLLPAASVLPTITVRENVALPLLIARRPPAPEAVDALLERVGLAAVADRRPAELTASDRQRVALARALIAGARIIVLDDPLSAVDTLTERRLVRRLRPALADKTVLVATQRLSTVELADRAVVLVDGVIVESGTPRDLLRRGGAFADLFGDEVVAA
jgi:putative ABC transport system ATP-binding protein